MKEQGFEHLATMGIHLQRAQALFDLCRFKEAIASCTADLADDPTSAGAYALRAAALVNLHQNHAALRDVRQALAIDPNYSFSFFVMSCAQANVGQIRKAEDSILESLRIQQHPDFYCRLAEIQTARRRVSDAVNSTDRALELDPRHVAALCLRARLDAHQGRLDDAKERLASALAVNAEAPQAHHALGALNLQTGASGDALNFLREARRINPIAFNDRDALASAYGRLLRPFRLLASHRLRFQYWPLGQRWALLASIATCLFAALLVLSAKHVLLATLFVVVFNLIAGVFSIDLLAQVAGKFAYRRDLDVPWHRLIPEVARIIAPAMLHAGATILAIGCASLPGIGAAIFAIAPSYEYLFRLVRMPSILRQFVMFWVAAFAIFFPGLLAGVAVGVDHEALQAGIWMCVSMVLSYICTVYF